MLFELMYSCVGTVLSGRFRFLGPLGLGFLPDWSKRARGHLSFGGSCIGSRVLRRWILSGETKVEEKLLSLCKFGERVRFALVGEFKIEGE